MLVYVTAHEEFKEEFPMELASFCSNVEIPYIVGWGDFNILRYYGEKNKKMNHSRSLICSTPLSKPLD